MNERLREFLNGLIPDRPIQTDVGIYVPVAEWIKLIIVVLVLTMIILIVRKLF